MTFIRNILNLLSPRRSDHKLLGRWSLKHNENVCEHYILNCYADPGYHPPLITVKLRSIRTYSRFSIRPPAK